MLESAIGLFRAAKYLYTTENDKILVLKSSVLTHCYNHSKLEVYQNITKGGKHKIKT